MLILALLAIIVPLVLLVIFRLSARVGMTISAAVVALVAFWFWQMTPLALGASAIQAVHRALTIGLILFGAVTLLHTLGETGALKRIRHGLHDLSADGRVQAVLVAFCFVSLIEGISGFGTPSIVAAPLLMILGFRPLAAASLALLGDTIACTFGAVGTPLLVGLENVPNYSTDLAFVVGAQVALFDLIIGTLLPLGMVALLIFTFGKESVRKKWHSLRAIAPWTLFIGLTYAITAMAISRSIGPEFASIIAGAVSLGVAAISVKKRWLIPRTTWRHHAKEDIKDLSDKVILRRDRHMPLWKAWLPYGVVIVVLLITRTVPSIKHFMNNWLDLGLYDILGIDGVFSSWAVLYSPGTILLVGAVSATLVHSKSFKPLFVASGSSAKTTLAALSALIPTLIMVQIFANSGINSSDIASMPVLIGQTLSGTFGEFWLAVAPLLGTIGAFISGSATVSTLTMAPVQYSIAVDTGLPIIVILALQLIGAAAGNIIAVHNVVAASVVVGLANREGLIIRKLLIPTAVYVSIAMLIGLVYVIV